MGDVADGAWHFLCLSWEPYAGLLRPSLDARASVSSLELVQFRSSPAEYYFDQDNPSRPIRCV